MKGLRFSLLLGVVISGCLGIASISPPRLSQGDEIKETSLNALHRKMLEGSVAVDGGTGFAISILNGGTYLMTAGHCLEGEQFVPVVHMKDGLKVTRMGVVIVIDGVNDLGLVFVPDATDYMLFEVMTAEEYDLYCRPGRMLMAAGCPGDVFPPFITIGSVREQYHQLPNGRTYLYHSTGGWYGFSGGPVVSVPLGKVAGLTVMIRDRNSSQMLAVPAPTIQKFLKEFLPK